MKHQVDPIIEEIHETRREIAQRFDFDVHRISADAKRRQLLEGRPLWRPGSASKAMDQGGGDTTADSEPSTPAGEHGR